ncbi:hypothetical protein SAMN03159512_02982 [Pseudomonas sp. NFR09]|nr:hypothetical protein SAMN03159512_02982 [Pseudomonas sp. NFR09]
MSDPASERSGAFAVNKAGLVFSRMAKAAAECSKANDWSCKPIPYVTQNLEVFKIEFTENIY